MTDTKGEPLGEELESEISDSVDGRGSERDGKG